MIKISSLLFWAAFFVSLLINILTLHSGHNWGGDFSQYIMGAQNLSAHKPYESGMMLEKFYSYPPGFSILLTPFFKIFGLNFYAFKFLNIFFWFGAVVCWYAIFKKKLDESWACLICGVLVCSSFFFTFKQNVLSDIPFFFFVSLIFYIFTHLLEHRNRQRDHRYFFFFLFLLIVTYLIRTAGIVLFVSTLFYFFVVKREYKAAFLTGIAFVCAFVIDISIRGSNPSFFEEVFKNPTEFIVTMVSAMALPLRCIALFLLPDQTILSHNVLTFVDGTLLKITPFVYLACLLILFMRLKKGTVSFVGCFVMFYFIVFIVWSGFGHSPGQESRLAIVLVAPFLLVLISSLIQLSKKYCSANVRLLYSGNWIKIFICAFILINIVNIYGNINFNDDDLNAQENQELFEWVGNNVNSDEHYMFWQFRPLALMTERVGTAPWTTNTENDMNFFERVQKLDISYLILVKAVDQTLITLLSTNPTYSQIVWQNPYYMVFKVQSDISEAISP